MPLRGVGLRLVKHSPLYWMAVGLLCSSAVAGPAREGADFSDKLMSLGTGPAGGAFRPVGESLCDALNEDRRRTLVRCVPVATAGSAFNLNAVAGGQLQLGIAQEDLLAGFDASADPAQRGALRAVAVLHTSPIAVVARGNLGVQTLQQIVGKRVNLGNRGSGQFAIVASLLEAAAIRVDQLGGTTHLSTTQFERAFCDGEVDVVVEAVAHPSKLFEHLLACGGRFVDIPPEVAARMQARNRFLASMSIPAGTYATQPQAVNTLGMRNVLFTNRNVGEEAVRRLTESLGLRYADLRAQQPLLASMPSPSQPTPPVVPLHRGAEQALLASGAAR